MRRTLRGYGAVLALLISNSALTAQGTPEWSIEATLRYRNVSPPSISPDGLRAAVVVREPILDDEASRWRSTLLIIALDAAPDSPPLWSQPDAASPAWSPDGRWLAFASSRSGARNVWRVPATGGTPEPMTTLDGGVSTFAWSPDGRWLAFVAVDSPSHATTPAASRGSDMRVLGEGQRLARLFVTPAEPVDGGRPVRLLTPEDVHVGGHVGAGLDGPALTWSPDASAIAFTHSPSPLGDDWVHADVSIVDLESGTVRPLVATQAAEGGVVWSPDGRWIAVVVTDAPATYALTTRVHLVSPATGEERPLADSFDRRPSLVGWSADSRRVLVSEARGVTRRLSTIPIDGGEPVDISPDTLLVAGVTLGADGRSVGFVSETSDRPPEGFVSPLDPFRPRRVTGFQPPVVPATPRTEPVRWRSFDGHTVEGLLTYPADPRPNSPPAPLLVILHGGPPSAFSNTFVGSFATYPIAVFAARGFAVLRPNVRGSAGYGRDFRYANVRDWGGGDHRDVIAGIDALAERGVIDASRVGIMGWSYGGYLTAISITRTRRFLAASIGAGITDLVSFSGTADIPGFVPSYYQGEFWEEPELWSRDSPIQNVAEVTTPTLIQHGELDERVPVAQGYQLYHALQRLDVPVRMLVFPGQGHALTEPRMQLEAARENVAWFERWVK